MVDKTKLLLANHTAEKLPGLLKRIRALGCQVLTAQNVIDTLAMLKEEKPEIVVLKLSSDKVPDYEMAALEEATTPWQEVILLLNQLPTTPGGKAFGNRISDFCKADALEELTSRIELALVRLEVKNGCRKQLEVLGEQSIKDYKTGVYNDRYIFRRLMEEYQRSSRHGLALSIIMLDLDGFKTLNDSKGHAFGDFVLQAFSKHMMSLIRKIDIPGRYGGDEFLILLPNTNIEEAETIAQRLRDFVDTYTFEQDECRAQITISQGVNTYSGEGHISCEQFLKGADKAVFEAKRRGRNQVCLYPDLPPRKRKG
jgi:two-component system cell cycle response regulator